MLSVKLPENLETSLLDVCKETRHTHDYHIKRALQAYLEDLEDAKIAAEAYKEYLKDGKKTIPWEEVKRKAGLLDNE